MYGLGRGRNSNRGSGLGFRGVSPEWPYVGIGRGGLPRCQCPATTSISREQELDFLKKQSETIKSELSHVESRISDLENDKQQTT